MLAPSSDLKIVVLKFRFIGSGDENILGKLKFSQSTFPVWILFEDSGFRMNSNNGMC